MIYIGIDPGVTGALAVVNSKGGAFVWDTPVAQLAGARRDYNVGGMRAMLETVAKSGVDQVVVVLEHVQAMPTNGSIGCFSLGYGFGLWRGIAGALLLRVELVRPVRWKKAMLDGRGKEKGASLQRARELFPSLDDDLKRVKDHNRAEALLLAEWGRRNIA